MLKYEETLEACDKAIELDPQCAEAYYNKGYTLGNFGRYEEALEAYDKAIELKPDYVGAYHQRSLSYP